MAARKRLAAVAVAATVLVTGCTYSAEEPGLFPTRVPSQEAEPPADQQPPQPTFPELPVAGEAVWTTGDGLGVTVRFAVHAVRRIPGATILDWSVTPIGSPVARFGDVLPAHLDLGLTQSTGGDVDVTLLDPPSRTAYAPLSHRSRRTFNHCLCSPVWLVQQRLRIGETRLMQVAYPELPPDTAFVDVVLANVAPFVHVPVTGVGLAPSATSATDLARPAGPTTPAAKAREIRIGSPPRQALTIQIDSITSSPGLTSVAWTVRAVTDQVRPLDQSLGLLVSRPAPDSVRVVNSIPTNGLVLKLPAETPEDLLAVHPGLRAAGVRLPLLRSGHLGPSVDPGGRLAAGHQPLSRPTGRHHVSRCRTPGAGRHCARGAGGGRTGRRRAPRPGRAADDQHLVLLDRRSADGLGDRRLADRRTGQHPTDQLPSRNPPRGGPAGLVT